MPFWNELDATHIRGTKLWKLNVNLIYTSKALNADFYVPEGYDTDLYSIPGPLRGFTFRSRKWPEPSVLHDAVCNGTLRRFLLNQTKPESDLANLTRKQGDALIVEAMKDEGCPKTLTGIVGIGTRLGSWFARGKIAPR